MKEKLKIRWWLHTLFVIAFIVTGAYLYHVAFLSNKTVNTNDLSTHKFVTSLIVIIICHIFWLLTLLIKLLYRRQIIPSIFILLFGLADICLVKVVGFLLATTMMG